MKSLESAIHVNAPPERVFAEASDLRGAERRVRAIKRLEVLTDGPIGVGTRFRETREMFGREATEEMEITAFSPGESYAVAAESHGCRYRSVVTVAPEGEGSRLSITFAGEPQTLGAKILAALTAPLMRKQCEKAFVQDLEDIRRAAEAG